MLWSKCSSFVSSNCLFTCLLHVIKSKEPKGSNQVFILIRWLCRNELLLQAILVNLTEIITNKADHFTAFGWCTFVRSLVELSSDQFFEGTVLHDFFAILGAYLSEYC